MKEATQNRKADTRKKIMLGGLLVKANLDQVIYDSPSTLYGMLLYCQRLSKTQPEILATWRELGKELIK